LPCLRRSSGKANGCLLDRIIVRLVACVGLAPISVSAISLIDKLPYSPARDSGSDFLQLPAYLIAGLIAPEGIHGHHPMLWAWSATIALCGTYAIIWFAIVSLLTRWNVRRRN
jgi:hypothetical protein